jgi:hypothetical protein
MNVLNPGAVMSNGASDGARALVWEPLAQEPSPGPDDALVR